MSLLLILLLPATLSGCGAEPQHNTRPPSPPPATTGAGIPSPAPTVPTPYATATPTPLPASGRPAATVTPDRSKPLTPTRPTAADGFPAPPDRDLYRLARELIPGLSEIRPVEAAPAPALSVGHRETFELVDLDKLERYRSEFELRLVTPHAYWFVEDGVNVEQEDIEKSAGVFEKSAYPLITGVFGTEWTPGVDGDPHLYVLNASLALVGGYYSPSDEYPKEIRPVSNEIEAVYINVQYIEPGTDIYDQVLAHELQHAIHWNADPNEDTWVNEGLSELAVTLAGYREMSVEYFRRAGPTSLTIWPAAEVGGAENYGAASLFMLYLTGHYGGRENLRSLLSQPADGIEGIDAYLESISVRPRFEDIFRDWAVANLLDEPSGKYGYGDLAIGFPVSRALRTGDQLSSTIPQYSTEYLKLENSTPSTLAFSGASTASLLPVDVGDGCWWSNSGDVIDSRLTAAADLRGLASPALDYEVWYAIEEDWDYAYLEVSVDEGETWRILETAHTSSSNPIASAFGPGYTGNSNGWQSESVSLAEWAGREIMLRFQYVTDAAINDHGLCLRGISLSDPSRQSGNMDWIPDGFVWTNNLVRQDYNVQVIYEGRSGAGSNVLRMDLDQANRGEMALQPDPDALRVVVAVQAMAPSTRLPASYTISLDSTE